MGIYGAKVIEVVSFLTLICLGGRVIERCREEKTVMNKIQLIENCIFCKIIRGETPSFKLYEDEFTLAFMDINPVNDGHALIIPKYHSENIYTTPNEWFAPIMSTVRRIANAVNTVV